MFNLFMGFRSWRLLQGKSAYKDFVKNVQPILDHIYKVLYYNDGDEELQAKCGDWFVDWLAAKYCRPWMSTEKTPSFISSVGGIGKSALILWLLTYIFGALYFEEVTEEHQLGQKFNARDRFLIFKFLDDLAVKNPVKLKALTTRKTKRIEMKGVDVELIQPPDFTDYLVCSNEFNPVELDKGPDRRNVQSECYTGLSSHTPEGREYLAALFELIDGVDDPTRVNWDAVEDFAFFLKQRWEGKPNWDRVYTPQTTLMQKKQREYEESQVLDTLRQFGEEAPRGFAGIPKACLFAYHVMVHEVKADERRTPRHPEEIRRGSGQNPPKGWNHAER